MIQSDLRLGTPGNHRAQSLARTNIHVPQMSQYRSVKVPVVVLEQHQMWQSTWNVIRFQCRLLDEKFMNKLFVISISPFATYSVELPHFLQRNSKTILIYQNNFHQDWDSGLIEKCTWGNIVMKRMDSFPVDASLDLASLFSQRLFAIAFQILCRLYRNIS